MSWYDFLPDSMEMSMDVLERNPVTGTILSGVGSVVAGVDVALHGQDSRFLTYEVNKDYLPNFYKNFVQSLQRNYTEDRSMLNVIGGSLWDGTYDFLGDIHGTPARLGSSIFITQNAVWNELFDKERTQRDFGETLDLAWNREAIANISPGQAWATLVGDIYEDTLNMAINSEERKQAFDTWTERNALFMNPDFDIFNEEQRKEAFEGTQNIGRWTSGLWDALPGQVLDPLNYLPIIGWGGKIGKIGLSLQKETNVSRHYNDLVRGIDGEVTESTRHFEWVAQASKGEIAQHSVYRESRNQMLFADLLGKVDNVEDAYRVHLAVEFGDEKAIIDLIKNPKYGGSQLLLDNLREGGYLTRQAKKGTPIEGVVDNPLYLEANAKYLDETLAESPFAKRIIDEVFVKDDAGAWTTLENPALRFRFTGNKFTAVKDQKLAEFRARALGDHENAFVWLNSGIQGMPIINLVVRTGIRYGRISGKGIIDVDDTAGDSYAVLLGNLNDLNRATDNRFLQEGLIEQYSTRYAAANNALERQQILDEIDNVGRKYIADKHGIDEITAKDIVDTFSKETRKYLNSLKENYFAKLPDGQILYDPLFPNQVGGAKLLTDWKLFDTAMVENKDALRRLFGMGKRAGLTWVHTFNNLFIAGILGRAARVPREILQNAPAAYLSGEMGEMFFTPEIFKAPKRFINNMRGRTERLKDRTATRFGVRDNVEVLNRNAVRHQEAITMIDDALESARVTLLRQARQFPENFSKTDQQIIEEIREDFMEEIFYHGSRDGLPPTIDPNRVFALTADRIDAQKYADDATDIISYFDELKGDKTSFEFGSGKAIAVDSKKVAAIKNSIKEQLEPGETLQMRRYPGDNWRTLTAEDVDNLKTLQLQNNEFRFLNAQQKPKTYKVSVYGKNIDINSFKSLPQEFVQKMGWKNADEFKTYMNNKSFANDKKFAEALEESDIGTFTWKGEVFANPNRVSYNKAARKEIKKKAEAQEKERLAQAFDEGIEEPALIGEAGELSRKAQVAQDYESMRGISETRTYLADTDMNNMQDIRNTIRSLKERKKYHQEQRELFLRRIKMREEQVEATGTIQRRGQEELIINGNVIPGAAQGADAVAYTRLASAEPTFDNTMQGARDLYRRVNQTAYKSTHVRPDNPEYFDSWSDVINREFRQGTDGSIDPVTKMVLEGKSDAEIIKWLRNDLDGIRYADSIGIGPKFAKLADEKGKLRKFGEPESGTKELMDFDDYVELSRYNIDNHIPLEIRDAFLNNEVLDAPRLRTLYAGRENELPDIIGRVSIKEERRNLMQLYYDGVRGFVKVVGEMPQTALYNHPMFTAMYKKYVTRNVQLAVQSKAQKGLSTKLSLDEINKITNSARKDALMEQRRWIYNVPKRTNASEALRLFFPFVSAWSYTYRLIGRGLAERPAETLWLLSSIAKGVGKIPYVDQNGDPTNNYFDSVAIVVPMHESVANALKKVPVLGDAIDAGNSLKISTKSMDVFFQGEFFDPGAGVVVAIPVSEVVKNNPALAENELIKTVLPFGPSQKFASYDLTLPGYTRTTLNMLTKSPEWQTTLAMVGAQESAKIATGEREDDITQEEIINKTNSIFMLRSIIGFASPVSFTIPPNQAFYRQEYLKYLETYPDPDEAKWRFLADHPEWYTGMQSTADNPGSIFASTDAVERLKDNKQLVSEMWTLGEGGEDMVGWLAKGSSEEEYSQPAWDWLKNNGPVAGQNYVSTLSPEEIVQRSKIAVGWAEWRKARNLLQETARQRGTSIAKDKELSWYNSRIIAQLAEKNPDWYREYASPDRNKYNDRTNALEIAFSNKQWVEQNKDRAVVPYISQFLQYRRDIAAMVDARAEAGGPRSLEGNKDLLLYYNDLLNQLMNESVEFAEFYVRYFERDMVI